MYQVVGFPLIMLFNEAQFCFPAIILFNEAKFHKLKIIAELNVEFLRPKTLSILVWS